MRFLRRLRNDQSGFALVLALGITVVLSMTVVTVIESTTANSRSAVQSKNRVSAYTLAEAGINNASSILAHVANAYDSHVLHPQPPNQPGDCAAPAPNPSTAPSLGNTCSQYVFNLDGGTATMSGWFDAGTANWYVTSVGQVRNPYGGQQTTRTLTATIHVRPQASQTNVVPAWNYVFVRDTTPNICNVTLDQTTALSSSLYTEGNVCFKNQGGISETNSADPVFLEARNMLVWLSGSTKGVGDAGVNPTQKISSAKIANGCTTGSVNASGVLTANTPHACTTANPYKDYFYVKTSTDCTGCGYTSSAPAISAPTLTSTDWDNYYTGSQISKLSPCNAGGLPASTFDNDSVRNNSLPAAFNLTPGTNYSCRTTTSAGSVVGELDWDATNHILSVRGNVYFDGNVTISGVVKYRGVNYQGVHPSGADGSDGTGGMMVLYASGTISLSNGGVFCGWDTVHDVAAYNSGSNTCDFSSWTPDKSMLMFVSLGGVTLNQSSYFQGAIFSPGAVTLGQSSQTEGPLIANTLTVGQSTQMKPLPGLADLPLGAPGNPNTSGAPDPPSYTGG
jgi:Tfp pilus assembly protein PilX